ncbi:hypothetical protein OY671_010432 [Metschnikowia pulcherrima]|nr:hypothetical protein OY671_010432 [Metschnikowia pulcherrima]
MTAEDTVGFQRTHPSPAGRRRGTNPLRKLGVASRRVASKLVKQLAVDRIERPAAGQATSPSASGRCSGKARSKATSREGFGVDIEIRDYSEHAMGSGTNARAAAYVECASPDGRVIWGVGIDEDVATASVRAILSAANTAR